MLSGADTTLASERALRARPGIPPTLDGIDAAAIDRLQRDALKRPADPADAGSSGLRGLIAANHCWNRLLWNEEDQARRQDVADAAIVRNKRAIDRYNQQRNDAIESIDDRLLAAAADTPPADDAWLNSETAGSIIDRLSINLLKVHHMGLQAQRSDASAEHRARCAERVQRLEAQREDLLGCLQHLLDGLHDGHCCFRIYRQFKMYNDPALNPCLHQGRSR